MSAKFVTVIVWAFVVVLIDPIEHSVLCILFPLTVNYDDLQIYQCTIGLKVKNRKERFSRTEESSHAVEMIDDAIVEEIVRMTDNNKRRDDG
ncbi:hypothetical protein T4D_11262 [Trichinella pseudospiralis]|uniref:Uncharacterized protein n=1 Tax=Trichinella pseudospiralis TaxID=6337 RepID=A0A0V1FWQ4_TRIPS|nr:hypothetical protein T4D_11262 [Trichinella pseudospiralis]